MILEADEVLVGNGLAPLLAAIDLVAQGLTVVILNPDLDFFSENSELPFGFMDPIDPKEVAQSHLGEAYKILSPYYPGALEFWSPLRSSLEEGFHDSEAPHLRGRTLVALKEYPEAADSLEIESLHTQLRRLGISATVAEGIVALKKFPGHAARTETSAKALMIPQVYDLDLERYRRGVLEFVWDRLGEDGVFLQVTSPIFDAKEVRFYSKGQQCTVRYKNRVTFFFTPRLMKWMSAFAKLPVWPEGVFVFEQWDMLSRDVIDPTTMGLFEGNWIWGSYEGVPESQHSQKHHSVSILRRGFEGIRTQHPEFLEERSMLAMSRVFKDFLKWERFTVRAIHPRAMFAWKLGQNGYHEIPGSEGRLAVVAGCDGPVLDVARVAMQVGRETP